jgi:maltose O-acetyltransferase
MVSVVKFHSLDDGLPGKRQKMHQICREFNKSPSKGNLKRLTAQFGACGQRVFIEQGFNCDYGDKIFIGDNVFINFNCTVIDGGNLSIGDNTLLGPNVQLLTIDHDVDPTLRLERHNYAKDICIGNNVWLAAGVTVLPGVSIGDNSVIGAASVVTKDVPANCLYAGNPARKIRELSTVELNNRQPKQD